MKINEALERIYQLQPAILSWTRTNRPNVLWADLQGARLGIMNYVGPQASELVLSSLHIVGDARTFIRSWEALHAMWAIVDAIYNNRPNKDGYLPEENNAEVANQAGLPFLLAIRGG